MMKICLAMAVFFMVGACGNGDAEQWLMRAEGCMETNQDSAFRCLQQIDVSDGLSDEQRARYALLRTQAMHKCHIPLENDSLINVAVAYYTDSDDRHRLALSLLYKGLVHKQCGEVTQAVEAFVASELAFEGVEDDQYKALLFNHYASLLLKQNMFSESLVYHKKSYQHKLLGDSIHYIVSTCGQIAKLFILLDMPDSAKAYYECGLSYVDRLSAVRMRNYYLLLQGYATFLIESENYLEAEKLLQECMENMTDPNYLHSLYSALTTLYYEKGELDKALAYGKQIVTSEDSLMVCAGYLRLYMIYKGMGETDSAFHYHNLYRQYNSDITMRRKTAEIASIPNRVKNMMLVKENRTLMGWKQWLVFSLVTLALLALGIYGAIRKRHRREQAEKEQDLIDTQKELADTKIDLGRMKGALTHQSNAVERIRKKQEESKMEHQKKIDQLKENIRMLEADIHALKEDNRERKLSEKALREDFNQLKKQLKEQIGKLEQAERQRETDLRIDHFVMHGRESVAVDMLLQLRYGEEVQARYDIRPSEYLPLLKELLRQENPAMAERLETCGLDRKKLTMCYLMALGLDDVEMMSRAACLSVNSVKAYRRECREVIEAPSGSPKGGEKGEG